MTSDKPQTEFLTLGTWVRINSFPDRSTAGGLTAGTEAVIVGYDLFRSGISGEITPRVKLMPPSSVVFRPTNMGRGLHGLARLGGWNWIVTTADLRDVKVDVVGHLNNLAESRIATGRAFESAITERAFVAARGDARHGFHAEGLTLVNNRGHLFARLNGDQSKRTIHDLGRTALFGDPVQVMASRTKYIIPPERWQMTVVGKARDAAVTAG